ncbi:MAG TPA: SRPBCC family protein, partial [Chthoniobacterales bacterium]
LYTIFLRDQLGFRATVKSGSPPGRRNFPTLLSYLHSLIRCIGEPQTLLTMTTNTSNTIRLHRVLKASPEKIYRAFLDGDALAKWMPPHGFTAKVHHLEAKVGGTYKMSFTNFTTGTSHSFGGTYVELKPNERIRHTDKFDTGLVGEMETTIALKEVLCGTELNITQEGVPAAIPPEACYLGWQESLTLLAQLVEPEIPDTH